MNYNFSALLSADCVYFALVPLVPRVSSNQTQLFTQARASRRQVSTNPSTFIFLACLNIDFNFSILQCLYMPS